MPPARSPELPYGRVAHTLNFNALKFYSLKFKALTFPRPAMSASDKFRHRAIRGGRIDEKRQHCLGHSATLCDN
jgi:hypothetical protein